MKFPSVFLYSHSVEGQDSIPGRVKPQTYEIDTCRFLAWRSVLLEQGKDWLSQYQDNETEWDIGSCIRIM